MIHLNVGCDMQLQADDVCTLVAMLRPQSGVAQWVQSERYRVEPRLQAIEYIDWAGNLCQRLTLPAGPVQIRIEAEVETAREIAVAPQAGFTPVSELPDHVLTYLLPSRYCPSDRLDERARKVVGDAPPGYSQVERIRSWIQRHIEYRYGVSDASTDAIGTLEDGAGVCRDFAHIGISLCRALQIPARMVVGFLHQLDPMDMHAWFEAFAGGRWYTFDATQEAPCGGRVVVAYGRDAADVALFTEYGPIRTTRMDVWVKEIAPEPSDQ